jgi:hypothetical protein
MRREGSPFQGLGTVAIKELSDNLSSARMLVLELLIVLTALAALYRIRRKIRSCCCGCLPSTARRCRPLSPSSDS